MKAVITIPDKPGSLCLALKKIKPLNMTHLESFCEHGNPWNRRFFIEADRITLCGEVVIVEEFPRPIRPDECRNIPHNFSI